MVLTTLSIFKEYFFKCGIYLLIKEGIVLNVKLLQDLDLVKIVGGLRLNNPAPGPGPKKKVDGNDPNFDGLKNAKKHF